MKEYNYEKDTSPLMEYFTSIELKCLILAEKYKVSQRENRDLKEEQEKLQQTIEKLRNDKKELKIQVNNTEDFQNSKKIAKIVTGKLKQAGETAEWKGLVEELVEEIDRCIELLKAY